MARSSRQSPLRASLGYGATAPSLGRIRAREGSAPGAERSGDLVTADSITGGHRHDVAALSRGFDSSTTPEQTPGGSAS